MSRSWGFNWNWDAVPAIPAGGYAQETFPQVPVLFEPFDTFTGAAAGGVATGTGAVVATDAVNKLEGAAAIDVQGGGTTGTATIGWDRTPASGNLDPTAHGIMAFLYQQPAGVQQSNSINMQLFRGGTSIQFSGGSAMVNYPCVGWQWQQFDPSIQTGYATYAALGTGIVRRRALISGTGPTRQAKFDGWYEKVKRGPSVCMIDLDDGYASQRDTAIPYLAANNMPFTMCVEYANLTGAGSGANQRLTVGNVTTLKSTYGSLMAICSQGDGVTLTDTGTYPTLADAVARLNAIKASFTSNGWVEGNNLRHLSAPNGIINAALIAALKADGGFSSLRGTVQDNYFGLFGHHDRQWCYPSWGTSTGGVLATLTAGIDLAISQGADWNIHCHDISSSAIGISETVFKGMVDHLAVRRAQGKCLIKHVPDWHAYRAAMSAPFA